MAGIVKSMGGALEQMDMERVAKVMDAFEKQFEDLDVQAAYVEGAMNMSTATTTPEDEVDGLIAKVADEYGLEVSQKLDAAGYVLVVFAFGVVHVSIVFGRFQCCCLVVFLLCILFSFVLVCLCARAERSQRRRPQRKRTTSRRGCRRSRTCETDTHCDRQRNRQTAS